MEDVGWWRARPGRPCLGPKGGASWAAGLGYERGRRLGQGGEKKGQWAGWVAWEGRKLFLFLLRGFDAN